MRNTWNATLCYVHAQLRAQTHGMLRCARSMYDSGWNTTVGLHLASKKWRPQSLHKIKPAVNAHALQMGRHTPACGTTIPNVKTVWLEELEKHSVVLMLKKNLLMRLLISQPENMYFFGPSMTKLVFPFCEMQIFTFESCAYHRKMNMNFCSPFCKVPRIPRVGLFTKKNMKMKPTTSHRAPSQPPT